MPDYIVEPKSRKDLRGFARALRKKLGVDNELRIRIEALLDVLAEIFEDFSSEIICDNELPPNIHADTDIRTGHIRIKESVYEGACDGDGRDRMTIAHEIAHYFTLCFCGFRLQRNFNHKIVKSYYDPEWQAKCFAGEFMIPYHLTGNMDPNEIVDACGVSYEAAVYQYTHRN